MAARFEVDQLILRKNLILIPQLLAILVTFGKFLSLRLSLILG